MIEAGLALLAACATTRFRPFRGAIRWASTPLGKTKKMKDVEPVVRATKSISRRLPLRLVCLQEGLAVQRMLRRRGIDARLLYGLHLGDEDGLAAHVWVEVEGRAVIGDEHRAPYASVASFP